MQGEWSVIKKEAADSKEKNFVIICIACNEDTYDINNIHKQITVVYF